MTLIAEIKVEDRHTIRPVFDVLALTSTNNPRSRTVAWDLKWR